VGKKVTWVNLGTSSQGVPLCQSFLRIGAFLSRYQATGGGGGKGVGDFYVRKKREVGGGEEKRGAAFLFHRAREKKKERALLPFPLKKTCSGKKGKAYWRWGGEKERRGGVPIRSFIISNRQHWGEKKPMPFLSRKKDCRPDCESFPEFPMGRGEKPAGLTNPVRQREPGKFTYELPFRRQKRGTKKTKSVSGKKRPEPQGQRPGRAKKEKKKACRT